MIVVTDGERILGIGDQGVGGLGIPIGKLSLYSLIGGIRPERTLPIVLDVGTDNAERIADPEYFGWRHERVTGKEYDDFIDSFVAGGQAGAPRRPACSGRTSRRRTHRPILQRYRDDLLTFNDDIQGTAAGRAGRDHRGDQRRRRRADGSAHRVPRSGLGGHRCGRLPASGARSPTGSARRRRAAGSGSSTRTGSCTTSAPTSNPIRPSSRNPPAASPAGRGPRQATSSSRRWSRRCTRRS